MNYWIQHGTKTRWHLFIGDSEVSTCGMLRTDGPDDPTITEKNPIAISVEQPDFDACSKCLTLNRAKDKRWM